MAVLERSELEASPLADLHAIADQIGLEGFRRMRKADLVDAILGETPAGASDDRASDDGAPDDGAPDDGASDGGDSADGDASSDRGSTGRRPEREGRGGRLRRRRSRRDAPDEGDADDQSEEDADAPRASGEAGGNGKARGGREAEGVVEVLGNGSAFLRVDPPEPSDDDVYISAAQVRRCELVSGDRVAGPVRTPRRSERYASLVRVDTINGQPADSVSEGVRYEDLPVAWPQERIALGSEDPTLAAIEWLTPIGLGSRAAIVGARGAGKTETLRRLLTALSGRDELAVSLVLTGARPEEIAEWSDGGTPPAAALSFAASPDAQAQAVERAVESAKRVASRGGNAVVLIDGLQALPPHAARKTLAAARNLREGGSLTVIATASEAFGGETTVISLDPDLTSTGRQPILDLLASATLRAELLVGDDGAEAIAKARAAALDDK